MDGTADPAGHAELSDSLALAFLAQLQGLPPAERVVFLLREGFGYGYADIGVAVGEPPAACREIFARARQRMAAVPARFPGSPARGGGLPQGVTGGDRALSEICGSYSKATKGASDASVHRGRRRRRRPAPHSDADGGWPRGDGDDALAR